MSDTQKILEYLRAGGIIMNSAANLILSLQRELAMAEAELAEQRITINDLRLDRDLAAYRDYYS